MQTIRAELHVHTVLSPCAEVEMIPPLIVQEALDRGITLIAITDHNASGNVAAVQRAARDSGLTVLPGMEVQTQEEVHVLCLFDELDQLTAWQAAVDQALPNLPNKPDFFGEQFIVDETGDYIRREERMLSASANLSIEDVCNGVNALGGLVIPAHVDRQAFGLIANLGFVPTDLDLAALEISRHLRPSEAPRRYPQLGNFPLIQSGDVHMLDSYLGVNVFTLGKITLAEIRLALAGLEGRSINILPSG